MIDWLRVYVLRVLNAKYSVSSWILNTLSFVAALTMFLLLNDPNTPDLDKFLAALPIINAHFWVLGLMVSAVIVAIGMAKALKRWVRYGALASLVLWVFGCVAFATISNSTTVILIIIPMLIFYTYLFLSTSLRTKEQA